MDASYGERVAEIKRMWVDPGWRGAGLGSRLLRHLEHVLGEFAVRAVGSVRQDRVRHVGDGHERVVREQQIEAHDGLSSLRSAAAPIATRAGGSAR